MSTEYEEIREALADYAHEAWAGWMRYLFSKCEEHTVARLLAGPGDEPVHQIIPMECVQRWQRQMVTPYAELSEQEKDSDRKEADKMVSIFSRWFAKERPDDNKRYYFVTYADTEMAGYLPRNVVIDVHPVLWLKRMNEARPRFVVTFYQETSRERYEASDRDTHLPDA